MNATALAVPRELPSVADLFGMPLEYFAQSALRAANDRYARNLDRHLDRLVELATLDEGGD